MYCIEADDCGLCFISNPPNYLSVNFGDEVVLRLAIFDTKYIPKWDDVYTLLALDTCKGVAFKQSVALVFDAG